MYQIRQSRPWCRNRSYFYDLVNIKLQNYNLISQETEGPKETEQPDDCSYPYRRVGKGCYLIQKDKISGDAAFTKCLRRGAYLENFETLNEAMLMKYELLKMNTGVHYYVGGRNINRYKTGGDWRWIKKNGKMVKMTYLAFDDGEPNGTFQSAQDCIFFYAARGYRFHSVYCAMHEK